MEKLNIAIVSKVKQGDLWAALQKKGWSVAEAARELKIDRKKLDTLLNMHGVPRLTLEEEMRLAELTGKTLEQMLPAAFKKKELLEGKRNFTLYGSYDPRALKGGGIRCLPSPTLTGTNDRDILLGEIVRRARLSSRETDVSRILYSEGSTQEEAANELHITKERVSQINLRLMKKLKWAWHDIQLEGEGIISLDALLGYKG